MGKPPCPVEVQFSAAPLVFLRMFQQQGDGRDQEAVLLASKGFTPFSRPLVQVLLQILHALQSLKGWSVAGGLGTLTVVLGKGSCSPPLLLPPFMPLLSLLRGPGRHGPEPRESG